MRWRSLYPCSPFCDKRFNAVDAILYIMFKFETCPAFYNVYYKTSYACNISASLLVLIGSTKIEVVSYAYSINIYCIPLLLVTVKCPVKYVYILTVSCFANTIATNIQWLFSFILRNNNSLSPVLIAHFLLIWYFSCLIQISKHSRFWFWYVCSNYFWCEHWPCCKVSILSWLD